MILEFYDISTKERPQAHVPLPPEATLDDVQRGREAQGARTS
jgi:hypothetical protein